MIDARPSDRALDANIVGNVLIWTLILCRGERLELTVRHWYVNTTRVALGAIGQRTRIRCFYRNEMLREV